METLSSRLVKLVFLHMKGESEQVGSEMAAHMPSLMAIGREYCAGTSVELGVGKGYSTLSFLAGLIGGGGSRLISYDISPYPQIAVQKLLESAPEAEEYWDFRLKDSVDAAQDFQDASVGLLFIDTDHRYEPTAAELAAWAPKIAPGGLICGHDYYLERMGDIVCGVKRAVDEFAAANDARYRLQVLPHDQGLFILWPK